MTFIDRLIGVIQRDRAVVPPRLIVATLTFG
jgi:hypothetical protein